MHKRICTDVHMAVLRKAACELASEHNWVPVFEVREEPGSCAPYWHMGNTRGTIEFSLTHAMTVEDLKRQFKSLMNIKEGICEICFENHMHVACDKCGQRFCDECYIRLFKDGQGVITCPFCRKVTGRRLTDNQVLHGIAQIRCNIQEKQRAGSQRHDLVEKTRAELEEKGRQAEMLYEAAKIACLDEGCCLLDPTSWLANQKQMRVSWEAYQTKMNSLADPIKNIMMSNEFAQYMEFMYVSYVEGFGQSVLDRHGHCDGAEVYVDLMKDSHKAGMHTVQAAKKKKACTSKRPGPNNGPKVGRNDLCPCGSGAKFKKCHGK